MIEKLFYADPYCREFDAVVLECAPDPRGARVILDRTAFYPTGGGQPHDLGTLGETRVLEVAEEDGRVVHWVERPLPHGPVRGEIDWTRRFDHMQQHHGQHLLSQAFLQEARAATISFHLGEAECTIDLECAGLPPDRIERAETLANRIIREGRTVESRFYARGELPPVDLRKLPPDVDRVRLVSVPEFDHTPCGGTHPARTSEVQLVKVLGTEKVKQKLRVSFVCGERALRRFDARSRLIGDLCARLKTGESALADGVARLQEEKAQTYRRWKSVSLELAAREGERLRAAAVECAGLRVVECTFADRDLSWLGGVAEAIVASGRAAAVLGSRWEGSAQLFLARSPDLEFDLRPVLAEVLALIAGKGGGRPHAVQAGGSRPEGIEAAVAEAARRVRAALGASAPPAPQAGT